MRYDLSGLGTDNFEDLSQTLALQIIGPGVSVFGAGRDGGREASFEGLMNFPDPAPEGRWDGYGVLQAKFRETPMGTPADTAWFKTLITKELNDWTDPTKNRVKHGRIPEYIVFTTNVTLSGVPGSGGVDSVNELIKSYSDRLPLKGWAIWHHEQICRYLDLFEAIRRTYAGFITPSDVLAQLVEMFGGTVGDLGSVLSEHAAKEMVADRWVRLGQAGHPDNEKLPLSAVSIDLPASTTSTGGVHKIPKGRDAGIVRRVLERGDQVRQFSRTGRFDPHVVVIGGPGQGKSTVGQMLCQAYRVALLADRPVGSLGPQAPGVLEAARQRFSELRLPTPKCRRWPILAKLSAYGDRIAGGEDVSLLRFLAETMSTRTEITPGQLRAWLGAWPWLLVLDGLDEVASQSVRETLMERISDFLVTAGSVDADLLIVATSRPQGYADEFGSDLYEQTQLLPLNTEQALAYATRLAEVRHDGDPDMRDQVITRVTAASGEETTARLMRTPLQVTIMSLLLERRPSAPRDRYGLFDAYYNVIYDREKDKGTDTARLLDEHRTNIDRIHEQVGRDLQIASEDAGDAEATMPAEDLREIAVRRLVDEGYGPGHAGALADRLVQAATDRLVLLVPRQIGTVGFELRSLQEMMAARSLTEGPDTQVMTWIRQTALSAHWRNTWLFAASRIFTHRQHLRKDIVGLLAELDNESFLALMTYPGANLALEMLEEDIARNAPLLQRILVERALGLIDGYPGQHLDELADNLLTVIHADAQAKAIVDRKIEQSLSGTGRAAVSAVAILAQWTNDTGAAPAAARQRLSRLYSALSGDIRTAVEQLAFKYFEQELAAFTRTGTRHIRASRPRMITELASGNRELDQLLSAAATQKFDEADALWNSKLEELLVEVYDNIPVTKWPHGEWLQNQLGALLARRHTIITAPGA